MSAPDALAYLIRLRADVVRLAHEVEGAADGFTGKRAKAVRDRTADLARRLRDAAMSEDLDAFCKRRTRP